MYVWVFSFLFVVYLQTQKLKMNLKYNSVPSLYCINFSSFLTFMGSVIENFLVRLYFSLNFPVIVWPHEVCFYQKTISWTNN